MKKFLTCAVAAATVLGGLGAASEASAQRWHDGGRGHYDRGGGHYGRGGRNDGAALALGVIAGAALSGGGYGYRQPYYGYGYTPRHYYRSSYRSYYQPRCWTEARWDPYYGRNYIRVCR